MRRLAVALSVLLVVALTLTPGHQAATLGDGATVWQRVSCVTCPPTWLTDVFSNVVLFVPLGVTLVLAGVAPGRATTCGAVFSIAIEALQLAGLPTGRAPAFADVGSNTLGTLLGAMLALRRGMLLRPDARMAGRLRAAWALACAGMLVCSALALSPASPVRDDAGVMASRLPFTPGYGWSTTQALAPVVNGVALVQRGTGPVIVAAARRATTTASLAVRGRDGRSGAVPIVFAHDPAMTTIDPRRTFAHLLLAQRGADAWLTSDLRAGRWGLSAPSLAGRDAFRAGRTEVSLRVVMTSQRWSLSWMDSSAAGEHDTATLALSPAIGWALVQGIVPASAAEAPVFTLCWLFAWFVPLGFWGVVPASARTVASAGVWALALLAVGVAAARLTGTATLSPAWSAWCVLASVAGVAARQLRAAQSLQ